MTEDIEQQEGALSDRSAESTPAMTWGLADWQGGVVGGIIGAAVMGLLISVMKPPVLEMVIPAMYKLSGGVAGWTIHLSHGAILGVSFVALYQYTRFDNSVTAELTGGLAWGFVTWVGLAALVMPVWLSVVGAAMPPMVPNFAIGSLIWHLVYGFVLGGTYHLIAH